MKVLQFYTSTGMRDAEKVNSQDALLSPTWKFLPFQIQREHLTSAYVTEVKIVDCDANETDVSGYFLGDEDLITGWTSVRYNTFVHSGTTILTGIESNSENAWAFSDEFALATGESIAVSYNLTLNSGDLPNLLLGPSAAPATTSYSKRVEMVAGGDIVYLTATGNASGNVRLLVENDAGNDTSFASTFAYIKRTTLDLDEKTTYDFISYNGEPLSTTLPYGVYYLKISDGNSIWYSEWFSVENIQPQLITSWPSETYDTFTLSGVDITSAIKVAAASALATTNTFTTYAGEKFIWTYDLTLNSGVRPFTRITIGGLPFSADHSLLDGLNEFEFTVTKSGTTARLALVVSAASNFALGSVSLRRKSGEYVHLEFTNARDFNNGDESIYYVDGWTQQAYLRAYENLPSHESIEVGSDKNGSFEAEKLVRKYTRSVVSYESRSMYDALTLMKNHTTIKILTEDGIEYTPAVGNVDVGIDWNTFDTGSLRIAWNEDGTVWTNSMTNIV